MKTIQNLQTKAANKQAGFTLIELMIVVAIVAILAAVALPAYNEYVKKGKFANVAAAVQSYKLKVELCHATEGSLADCDAGNNGIPAEITGATGDEFISTLSVTDGVISATATADASGYSYTLTPDVSGTGGRIEWDVSGTCVAANFC